MALHEKFPSRRNLFNEGKITRKFQKDFLVALWQAVRKSPIKTKKRESTRLEALIWMAFNVWPFLADSVLPIKFCCEIPQFLRFFLRTAKFLCWYPSLI